MQTTDTTIEAQLAELSAQVKGIADTLEQVKATGQTTVREQKRTRKDLGLVAAQAQFTDLGVTALLCAACVGVVGVVKAGVVLRESIQENAPPWLVSIIYPGLGSAGTGQSNDNPAKVIAAAKAWVGKDFKPGVTARCADWVREVLKEAGVEVGVARGSAGPLMADSFHGAELGELILDPGQLQPGDIVMFADTYNGPGRSPIPGRGQITHVGIYVGGGEIIDRSTMSAPVRQRALTTFKFHSALRPSAYAEQNGGGNAFIDRYVAAIAKQESGANYGAVNPHSGALGKYQFMPSTLVSTAQNCPGVATVPSQTEFLNSPEIQDKIMGCYVALALPTIQGKASDEFTQCRMLAAYHYSGDPDLYDNNRPQSYAGAAYPSIAEYTKSVCKGF